MSQIMEVKCRVVTLRIFTDYIEVTPEHQKKKYPNPIKFYCSNFKAISLRKMSGYPCLIFDGFSGSSLQPWILNTYPYNSTIVFEKKQEEFAQRAFNHIQKMLDEFNKPKSVSPVIQQSLGADELLKFKQLLDSGLITQDEFNAKKKQLLGI